MPGLIFICSPPCPPAIYAARQIPVSSREKLYRALTCNTFRNGLTCPGAYQYPHDVGQIPESFFTSFFSLTGNPGNRSQRHP